MALPSGTKLGPYEIVAPIGAGGMGEVYRAKDTRLGRDVAIKVLPEGFARDAPGLLEFGVILAICGAGWFLISGLLLGTVFHVPAPDMSEVLYRGFLDSSNRSQVLAYICVGGMLATADRKSVV